MADGAGRFVGKPFEYLSTAASATQREATGLLHRADRCYRHIGIVSKAVAFAILNSRIATPDQPKDSSRRDSAQPNLLQPILHQSLATDCSGLSCVGTICGSATIVISYLLAIYLTKLGAVRGTACKRQEPLINQRPSSDPRLFDRIGI